MPRQVHASQHGRRDRGRWPVFLPARWNEFERSHLDHFQFLLDAVRVFELARLARAAIGKPTEQPLLANYLGLLQYPL